MPDLDTLITHAYIARASDIHIDPQEIDICVRYRIDGVMYPAYTYPHDRHPELIARIKILSGMRVDEHFKPQDGRWATNDVDIRASVLPTIHGQNAVLRLLRKKEKVLETNTLDEIDIQNIITRDRGLILVSGPTGSGKTTTLYTLLSRFVNQQKVIVTIEDPVEYTVHGVRQIQVRHGHVTFAHGLRAVLRQDPDVIMIGEIRDAETAQVAVHAALTGHIVLSTIHTESAEAVYHRLVDMGIATFQLNAVTLIAIAQRLVRTLVAPHEYRGRSAIYELKIQHEPYITLAEKMRALVQSGKTDWAEAERVLGRHSFL